MRQKHIGKTCPFCQFPIKQDSETILCSSCQIPHHRECWLENGGCTTFGCRGLSEVVHHLRASASSIGSNRIVVDVQEENNKLFKHNLTENYSYRKPGNYRLLAATIDLIISVIPFAFLAFFYQLLYIINDYSLNIHAILSIVNMLAILWFLLYLLARDSFGLGQSWGKKVCGLMVVRLTDDQPCKTENSLLRNILLPLFIIEFLVPLGNSKGQRLGDMLAKTQVIEKVHY